MVVGREVPTVAATICSTSVSVTVECSPQAGLQKNCSLKVPKFTRVEETAAAIMYCRQARSELSVHRNKGSEERLHRSKLHSGLTRLIRRGGNKLQRAGQYLESVADASACPFASDR